MEEPFGRQAHIDGDSKDYIIGFCNFPKARTPDLYLPFLVMIGLKNARFRLVGRHPIVVAVLASKFGRKRTSNLRVEEVG